MSEEAAAGAGDVAIEPATTATTMPVEQKKYVTIAYVLEMLGFVLPFLTLAALILAYIKRGEATNDVAKAHYTWLIRTFWWSMLWFFIGGLLSMVFVGFVVLIAAYVWMIYRIVKGFLRLQDNRAPGTPKQA